MKTRTSILLLLFVNMTALAQDVLKSEMERTVGTVRHRLTVESAPVLTGDSLRIRYELINQDSSHAVVLWDPAEMVLSSDSTTCFTVDVMGDWRYNPGFVQPLFLMRVEAGSSYSCDIRLPVVRRAGSDSACRTVPDDRLPGEVRYLYLFLALYRDDGLFSGVNLEDLRKNGFRKEEQSVRFENGLQSVLLGPVVFFVKE